MPGYQSIRIAGARFAHASVITALPAMTATIVRGLAADDRLDQRLVAGMSESRSRSPPSDMPVSIAPPWTPSANAAYSGPAAGSAAEIGKQSGRNVFAFVGMGVADDDDRRIGALSRAAARAGPSRRRERARSRRRGRRAGLPAGSPHDGGRVLLEPPSPVFGVSANRPKTASRRTSRSGKSPPSFFSSTMLFCAASRASRRWASHPTTSDRSRPGCGPGRNAPARAECAAPRRRCAPGHLAALDQTFQVAAEQDPEGHLDVLAGQRRLLRVPHAPDEIRHHESFESPTRLKEPVSSSRFWPHHSPLTLL